MSDERRKNNRRGLQLSVELAVGEMGCKARTLDISLCGVAIEVNSNELLPEGAECSLILPIDDESIQITCVIIRRESNQLGLEFIEPSMEKSRRLTQYLKRRL